MVRSQICTVSKRFVAPLLILAVLLALCACNTDDGEKNAVAENKRGGYSFSYPETWTLVQEGDDVRISADLTGGSVPKAYVKFTSFENSGLTKAEDYWNEKLCETYESADVKRGDFEFEGGSGYEVRLTAVIKGGTNLDGQPEDENGTARYAVSLLIFLKEDRVCVATYMATTDNNEDETAVVETIKTTFKFTDKSDEGASFAEDAADFSVTSPEGWTIEEKQAYYKFSKGKATLTIAVYSAGDNSTAEECWENLYEKEMKEQFEDYKLCASKTEDEGARLGEIPSVIDTEYTAGTVTGGKYHFRQLTGVYAGQVYVITLTASEADYADAVGGFEELAESFKLK